MPGWVVGCWAHPHVVQPISWVAGWMAGWLPAWLAGWLAGWLAAWLAGWLAGWMAGWLAVRCGSRDAIQGARERPENLRTFISWAFSWSSWAHPHVYVYICMPWGPQGCQRCHGCHMCPQYIQVCVCTTAFTGVAQSSPEQPRGAQVQKRTKSLRSKP